MTTAARPTFDPARGGTGRGEKDLSSLSKQYSSRDLPGHTKLKYRYVIEYTSCYIRKQQSQYQASGTHFTIFFIYREQGQSTTDELRQRDFRKELEDREGKSTASTSTTVSALTSSASAPAVRRAVETSALPAKKAKLDLITAANLDQDDPVDNDSSSDDSDSDDDTAALLAELNKIKRERAQESAKKEIEQKQEEERIRLENILSGNPLLNYSAGAKPGGSNLKVKRRWDDDVVFKNCARSEPEKKGAAFVNDSLRSDFHRKFMEKYIK